MPLPNSIAMRTVSGEIVAADHNNNYSDIQTAVNGLISFLSDAPACRVYRSSNQSVSNSTMTAISFDSERFDNDTIHDTGANTSRLTCNTAGVYVISGSVAFDSNATGLRQVLVRLNGSTIIASVAVGALSGAETQLVVSTVYKLAVGDYVELVVQQASGGSLNVPAHANYTPEFGMAWQGKG